MATGKDILKQLQSLTEEELNLPCVCIHTEYSNSEDSMGYDVEHDIGSVYVEAKTDRHGRSIQNKQHLRFGY